MNAFDLTWNRLERDGSSDAAFLRSLYGPHNQPPQFPIDTSARFTPVHDVQMILALINSVVGDWVPDETRQPAVVVEIGCNEGQTTADIARNFPQVQVFGIDIADGGRMDPSQRGEAPAESRIGIRAQDLDNVHILKMPSWELEWDHLVPHMPPYSHLGTSRALWHYRAPFVFFIDGDHSFAGVRSDTLLCLDMLYRTPCGGMLIWHDDYEDAPEWCAVRRYLNQQRLLRAIRIRDTWVSFAVVRPPVGLQPL